MRASPNKSRFANGLFSSPVLNAALEPARFIARKFVDKRLEQWRYKRAIPGPDDYHRPILGEEAGNQLIYESLNSGRPFLAGRIGAVELVAVSWFTKARLGSRRQSYPVGQAMALQNNAGVFPPSDKSIDQFAEESLKALNSCDVVSVWHNPGEDRLVRDVCPEAALAPLRSLEPYYHAAPWTRALQGRRVLVIHPFAESIETNYKERRRFLFADQQVLPEFHLEVFPAVQSIAGQTTDFGSWREALDSMKVEINRRNFDVLLVGAGAYGLPLAAHAKSQGAQAVVVGGATQILFGIKGRRWDEHPEISTLYNEHWTRPLKSETPENFSAVEDGCYW